MSEIKTLIKSLPALLVMLLVLGGIFALFHYVDDETINAYIQGAGIWAPLALVVAKASTIVIAPLGGAPLYPLAGALFGFWPAVLYLMLGDIIGATIAFWLSRLFGKRVVQYFFPENALLNKVLHVLGTFRGFLTARIALIALPEVIAYGAGLTRMRFSVFFIIFAVIELAPTSILAALGTFLRGESGSLLYTGVLVVGMFLCAAGLALFARYVQAHDPALKDINHEALG